jgi:hypothetical protein
VRRHVLLVLALLAVAGHVLAAEQTLIAPGANWRYNDTGADLGTAWRAPAYPDAGWSAGPAQLGYGDGDEASVVSFGANPTARHITTYFRHAFNVTDPGAYSALTLRLVRDDGAVVYLNGVEVFRSNLPGTAIGFGTLATTAISGTEESAWLQATLPTGALVAGTNVLAVEIHQQSASSSDISFDLELRATEAPVPAPSVTLVSPPHQSLENRLDVTFSGSVSAPAGLAEARLLVGGPPITVVFTGPAQVVDAGLSAATPTTTAGSATSLNVDGQNPHAHVLLAVPALVGSGAGQIPAGSTITSATLRLTCTNFGNLMQLYRLTEEWVENEATWNSRRAGVPWSAPGADGPGAHAGSALAGDCTTTGQRFVDVTPFVQAWSDGAPNFGLVFTDSGTDGVDFGSSESADSPVLTVVYRSNEAVLVTQPLNGTAANLSLTAALPVGTHWWNIELTDSEGTVARGAADFELTVDPSYPDAPVPITPLPGAGGGSPALPLAVRVRDPGGGMVTAQVALRPAAAPEFTIIAMPDTQHYSEAYPQIFTHQTEWIVANKVARNIVFVTHEGDIVQNNNVRVEWDRADASLSLLDGVVPYGMGPGNHDQPTTLYNEYFPYTRYEPYDWYGGHYQNLNDNNYQLFSASDLDFVIVHLAFCPPAGAVAWADSVFKAHPDRIGIMTTHGYLNESAQRSVHGCANTQYLWDGLAVPNSNLHFMLSGHVHDESRRTDTVNGHPVYQMLADFQDRPEGGEGWLRILRFVPAEDQVHVSTYSPWLDRHETDANSQFSLPFPMAAPMADLGSASVPSGALASIVPTGLAPFTAYEWQVTVSNGAGKSRAGPVWQFTTGADGLPADADTDGSADVIDNCLGLANADQRDTDVDGYGNLCDADFNNNGLVDSQDGAVLRSRFGSSSHPHQDLNGNGVVDSNDGARLKAGFGQPPGPSGIMP